MNEVLKYLYYIVFAMGILTAIQAGIQLFVGSAHGMDIRSKEGTEKIVRLVVGCLMVVLGSVGMII